MAFNNTTMQVAGGQRSDVIVQAATRMARLLVRLFAPYLQGTTLLDLLKQALLEHAQQRTADKNARVTLTELSLQTGIDTRTIRQMLDNPLEISDRHICAEAAILTHWQKDPCLRGHDGKPMELPILGGQGSFQGLVMKYAGRGISTRAVVDRLVKAGNIAERKKLFVRLVDPNWRFIEDREDEILNYGTQALDSLATCIANNLEHRHNSAARWTERRVYSVRVPESMRKELQQAINRLLLQQKDAMHQLLQEYEDMTIDKQPVSLGAGYYFWVGVDEKTE
ncbi:MAG: hypothetical protein Tsb002_13800 [Wenzhouxiangellaceae bacterium]